MRRAIDPSLTRLPLVPLPDFVLFPHTELRLSFTAADRDVVEDVLLPCGRDGRAIGAVLLKPAWAQEGDEATEVFPAGTAGQLADYEASDDGGYRVLLRGEYRFEVTEQLAGSPLPEAIVEPLEEPYVSDVDPAVLALRDEMAQVLEVLSNAQAEPLDWAEDLVVPSAAPASFEGFVNRVAAGIDVTPLRKLSLLADPLPRRADNLLSIMRSRQTLLSLLQPYRHLARHRDVN